MPNTRELTVEGTVTYAENRPAAGLQVLAVAVADGSSTTLGSAQTDARGWFRITASTSEGANADLRLDVLRGQVRLVAAPAGRLDAPAQPITIQIPPWTVSGHLRGVPDARTAGRPVALRGTGPGGVQAVLAQTTSAPSGEYQLSLTADHWPDPFAVVVRVDDPYDPVASDELTEPVEQRIDLPAPRLATVVGGTVEVQGETKGPIAGITARAYDQLLGEIGDPGHAAHVAGGRYQIVHLWPGARPVLSLHVDLLLRDQVIARSPVQLPLAAVQLPEKAAVPATDFTGAAALPEQYAARPSQYGAILKALGDSIGLDALTRAHRPGLAAKLGEAALAGDFIDAQVLIRSDGVAMNAATAFALIRRGAFRDLGGLRSVDLDQAEAALRSAIALNLVSEKEIGGSPPDFADAITQAREQVGDSVDRLDLAASGLRPALELAGLAPDGAAPGRLQRRFARLQRQYGASPGALWDAVRADPDLGAQAARLQRVLDLWEVALQDLAGLRTLDAAVPTQDLPLAPRLATWSIATWQRELAALPAPPDRYHSRDAYMLAIMDRLERLYPDDALERIFDHPDLRALDRFVELNPSFHFATTSVASYLGAPEQARPLLLALQGDLAPQLHEHASVDQEDAGLEALRRQLILQESAVRLTLETPLAHRAERITALLASGAGAREVARRRPTAADVAQQTVYRKAVQVDAVALTLAGRLVPALNTPLAVLPDAAREAAAARIPDWQRLFGSTSAAECDHCASVYSPSAYLVELLTFLNDRVPDQTGSAAARSLLGRLTEGRRPDLVNLELTCQNTNAPVPYIDLVNEILERAVVGEAPGPHGWPQTISNDAATLRAYPDHLDARAYEALNQLREPFARPFDLPSAEAEAYLQHAAVTRADLIIALQGQGAIVEEHLATACIRLGITPGDLALLRAEDDYVVAFNRYPAANGAIALTDLLRDAGVEIDELEHLLQTGYVRGEHPAGALLAWHPDDPENVARAEVVGLDLAGLVRLDRFLRLRRILGWSDDDVDRAITVLAGGLEDSGALDGLLVGLAQVEWLKQVLDVDAATVLNLVADELDAASFDRTFRSRLVETVAGELLAHTGQALSARHLPALSIALGVGEPELGAFLAELGEAELDRTTLAGLYRRVMLCRALRLRAQEYRKLIALIGLDPFRPTRSLAQLIRFTQVARSLSAERQSIGRLSALLLHDPWAAAADAAAPWDRLFADVRSALAEAGAGRATEPGAAALGDRVVQLAATALGLDEPIARQLLTGLVRASHDPTLAAIELLLRPEYGIAGGEVAALEATTTFERIFKAALIVRELELPQQALPLLFAAAPLAGWIDPNHLPLTGPDEVPVLPDPVQVTAGPARTIVLRANQADVSAALEATVNGRPWLAPGQQGQWSVVSATPAPTAGAEPEVAAPDAPRTAVTFRAPALYTLRFTVTAGGAESFDDTTVTVSAGRVEDGLVALYEFEEAGGAVVHDTSGVGEALDLYLADPAKAVLGGGKLSIASPTVISSTPAGSAGRGAHGARKLFDALTRSGALTIEAWLTPRSPSQPGPARIVSMSTNTQLRNFTLGQDGSDVVFRLRTTANGDNGTNPYARTAAGPAGGVLGQPVPDAPLHLVCTFQGGVPTIYVDGQAHNLEYRLDDGRPRSVQGPPLPGTFLASTGAGPRWSPDFPLLLGNEATGDRPWLGDLHLVAIYARALSQQEVESNRRAGPDPLIVRSAAEPLRVDAGPDRRVDFDQAAGAVAAGLVATVNGLDRLPRGWLARWTRHRYFHRRWLDRSRWTAWSQLGSDVSGDQVVPIFHNRRLYLFWPDFRDTAEQPAENAAQGTTPEKYYEVDLYYIEYRADGWSPVAMAEGTLKVKNHSDGELRAWDPEADWPLAKRFELLVTAGSGNLWVTIALRNPRAGAMAPGLHLWGGFTLRSGARHVEAEDWGYVHIPWNPGSFVAVGPGLEAVEASQPLQVPMFQDSTSGRQFPLLWSNFAEVAAPPATLFVGSPIPYRLTGDTRRDLVAAGLPVLYEDDQRTLLLRAAAGPPGGPPIAVDYFHHPFVGEFAAALDRYGVDGLLKPDPASPLRHQQLNEAVSFASFYQPSGLVAQPYPIEEIDFSAEGAASIYNWEIFFHIPLLLAKRLSANQRFAEAQKWFHFIFDPTSGAGEYWQIKPFRAAGGQRSLRQLLYLLGDGAGDGGADPALAREREVLNQQIAAWRADPFDPHAVAQLRLPAYQKAVVMAYLDNLIAWGDQLFRQDTIETINEASQLYVLAAEIMGPRPPRVPARPVAPTTFAAIVAGAAPRRGAADGIEDHLPPGTRLNGAAPAADGSASAAVEPLSISPYFCLPQNTKLTGYWDTIADRLTKIRTCRNIEGVERALALFEPPLDPGALVAAAARGGLAAVAADVARPLPPYRFSVLVERAIELANEIAVRLGAPLLQGLERRDAAALAELKASQDLDGQSGTRTLRQLEMDAARAAVAALQKSKAVVQDRLDHFAGLHRRNAGEAAGVALKGAGFVTGVVAGVLQYIAAEVALIPDVEAGAAGISSPFFTATTGGQNAFNALTAYSNASQLGSSLLDRAADIASGEAALERRDEEWELEKGQAMKQLDQLKAEIAAADKRVDIAIDNYNTLEFLIEQARTVDRFMRSRYTDAELYGWLAAQLSSLYFQGYQLAYELAKRAERALQFELAADDARFIKAGRWDSLRQGLTSAEGLLVDLRRMQAAYLERNTREFEITKRVNLGAPELARLKANGWVLDLPESAFDADHPGHYLRRIKSVALTVHARDSQPVPARLTLFQSAIRHSTGLTPGYARVDPDSRFTVGNGAASISTSGAPEDRGLFALDYADPRYLPFEGRGAADSRWKIDLYPDLPRRDLNQIDQITLRIDYTARDGGQALRDAAVASLRG